MRTVVIGGTGHIGTFLIPQLVARGHDVILLSRGLRSPYRSPGGWPRVRTVEVDREAEDAAGTFGDLVARLDAEVVADLICFTEDSARQLGEALAGRVQHLLHCGSIWVHGPSSAVPTREDSPRRPLGDYGVAKAAIELYLLSQARSGGVPATVIHPGHITGPGWIPINPAGNLDLGVFQDLADGNKVTLPNLGMETLQHVHAADVAGVFVEAIAHRSVSVGESFHAVASGAMTLRGYAEAVRRLVRSRRGSGLPAMGTLVSDHPRRPRRGHLGPPHTQPALLDGQDHPAARLPTEVLGTGCSR